MKPKSLNKIKVDAFDFPEGKSIAGKYRVISKLGSGWEGEVYKVIEKATGIERAAKFFYPQRNLKDKASIFYAKKLHKLNPCSLLIQYHTREETLFRKIPITVLISEYVEGQLLSEFLHNFPGHRLDPYKGFHLLYALVKGIEEIHLLKEYHGDLHLDNIIVNKFGLHFDLKLLDMYHFGPPKPSIMQEDILGLIHVFYEVLGGRKHYAQQPPVVKKVCCGLKRSLILKKFRNPAQLREYLENMDWQL